MPSKYSEDMNQHRYTVPKAFGQWIQKFGIEEQIAPILHTVITWANHTSPPEAEIKSRTLSYIYLATSCFYIGDYEGEDYQRLLEEFSGNLAGKTPKTQRPITLAHADLVRQLRALNYPMHHFVRVHQRLLDELHFKNRVMRGEEKVSFHRYLECGIVTICVYQWFEFWLLLEGIELTAAERSNSGLKESVRLTATLCRLSNELYSFDRDILKGEPNLVALFRNENAVSLNEAVAQITKLYNEAKHKFAKAHRTLLFASSTTNLRLCGELLHCFEKGEIISMHKDPERYTHPDRISSGDHHSR